MIGIVIREMTFLKVLAPVIQELSALKENYNIYHFDAPRGDKEYNRATLPKIKKSNPEIINKAVKVKAFKNDAQLQKQLVHDGIKKLVSLEIWLWAKSYISFLRKNNIKTYSILYLTDSLWEKSPNSVVDIDRIYYSGQYLRDTHLGFTNVPVNPVRDKCLGFPGFDSISGKSGDDILVLLPNLKKEHVNISFGSKENFIKIIEKLHASNYNLIFKTRKKQWLPKEIRNFAKEIVDDGESMYPPEISRVFDKTFCTVMFYSSGIYESIYASNFTLNIKLPLKRWPWNKLKMKEYFSTNSKSVYNWEGVVHSVDQKDVLSDNWTFEPQMIDPIAKDMWLDKFVGCSKEASKKIAQDIAL